MARGRRGNDHKLFKKDLDFNVRKFVFNNKVVNDIIPYRHNVSTAVQ